MVPYDCGVTFQDQLEKALLEKIDILFVTNHNTLDGYQQLLDYQENHEKYKNIKIYPAEEITTNTGGHVLAYGINEEIKPNMTLDETLDIIKKQNAVSCAAHPFAVSNGIRENAKLCDLIESFNSNNIDSYSNIVAEKFSIENNLKSIVGSDSHVRSTIGRCTNIIDSENNVDTIVQKMKKGHIKMEKSNYANENELYEHAYFCLSSSRDSIIEGISKTNPKCLPILRWCLDSYLASPNSRIWHLMGNLGLYLSKRVSKKVNIHGYNPKVLENRSWKNLISLSLIP